MRSDRWQVLFSVVLVAAVMVSIPSGAEAADASISVEEALAQAAETGEPVEVTSEITPTVDMWAQPDGTVTADVASGPVRVEDPEHPTAWIPIDTTLSDTGDSIMPAATAADLAFSDGGTDPVVTMVMGVNSFGLATEILLPAPFLDGDTATYQEVQPGIDLVLSALPSGFTERYVVEAPEHAPATVSFPLVLEGLTASVDEAGALVLNDLSGAVVARSAPARMWGATMDEVGLPVAQENVPMAVVDHGDGPVLELTPDQAFFTRPDVTYPVTIDPATDLTPDADTYVRSDAPTTSYGNDDVVLAGRDSTRTTRAYLHFDVSGLAGTVVTDATLKLYETGALTCSAPQMDVLALEETWTESTTWNGQPTQPTSSDNLFGTTTGALGYSGSCPAGWVSISGVAGGVRNLGYLVNLWLMGGADNDGILLKAHDESQTDTWRRFKSSEAASQNPTLSVTYVTGSTAMGMDTMSEAVAQYLMDQNPNLVGYDGCAGFNVTHTPDYTPTNGYKDYPSKYTNQTEHLGLDEYWPDDTNSHPLIVLVHGGGFWRGCRAVLSSWAWQFAQNGFVVALIDYRLACVTDDPFLINMDSSLLPRCGWFYRTEDTASGFGQGEPGAPFHDVLDAIAYARTHINSDCGYSCWDETNVFVGGGSGGGTQAFMAAAVGYQDGGADYQVDGALAWSGTLEMGTPTCDGDYSRDPFTCWTQENHYVCQGTLLPNMHNIIGEEDSDCIADQEWSGQNDYEQAVPYGFYTSEGGGDLPPIFFSNGGFCSPNPCNENIGYQGSADLQAHGSTNVKQCAVATQFHGTQYLNDSGLHCSYDLTVTVFTANVDWLETLTS